MEQLLRRTMSFYNPTILAVGDRSSEVIKDGTKKKGAAHNRGLKITDEGVGNGLGGP
jgi:hypothetical protein